MASRSVASDKRLLHQRIIERGPLAVHAEHVEPRVERADDPGRRVGVDAVGLIGWKLGDDVHFALQHGRDPRGRLRDRPHDPAIDIDAAAPVVRVGIEDGFVILHPRREPDRARPHRLRVEGVVADRLQVFLGHDLAAVEPEARRQERVGLLAVNDEGVGVRSLDPIDRAERRRHHGLDGGIVRPLDAELRVGRGERVAVVELDALAQLEGPRRLILELPFGGETGIELAVRMAAREVVEEIEGDADVVRRCAEVRVELRDVAALSGDELLLLRRLSLGRRRLVERCRDAQRRPALQQLTSGHLHRRHLHGGVRDSRFWRR